MNRSLGLERRIRRYRLNCRKSLPSGPGSLHLNVTDDPEAGDIRLNVFRDRHIASHPGPTTSENPRTVAVGRVS